MRWLIWLVGLIRKRSIRRHHTFFTSVKPLVLIISVFLFGTKLLLSLWHIARREFTRNKIASVAAFVIIGAILILEILAMKILTLPVGALALKIPVVWTMIEILFALALKVVWPSIRIRSRAAALLKLPLKLLQLLMPTSLGRLTLVLVLVLKWQILTFLLLVFRQLILAVWLLSLKTAFFRRRELPVIRRRVTEIIIGAVQLLLLREIFEPLLSFVRRNGSLSRAESRTLGHMRRVAAICPTVVGGFAAAGAALRRNCLIKFLRFFKTPLLVLADEVMLLGKIKTLLLVRRVLAKRLAGIPAAAAAGTALFRDF